VASSSLCRLRFESHPTTSRYPSGGRVTSPIVLPFRNHRFAAAKTISRSLAASVDPCESGRKHCFAGSAKLRHKFAAGAIGVSNDN